jgi:hypothetical protein
VLTLLLGIACTDTPNPANDDSVPVDDSGTHRPDDSGDDSGGGDSGDDSGTPPDKFEVVLTPFPTMVNEVTAAIALPEAHAIRVACEATIDSPWPERIVVRDAVSKVAHTIFLDALLANTTYTCTVDDAGAVLGTFDVTTDPLPAAIDYLEQKVEFDDPAAFAPGWTLFTPTKEDSLSGAPVNNANIVVDALGQIRWYLDMAGYDGHSVFEYDVAAQQFYGAGGSFNIVPVTAWDMAGNVVMEWPEDIHADHDMEKVGDDYYLVTPGPDGGGGTHCIEQRNAAQKLLWSWCSDEEDSIPDTVANSIAVQVTPTGTFIYGTMQNKGIVYKLNRDTRQMEWLLKENGDFKGDIPYAPWVHDIHVIDCAGYTECLVEYVNGTEEDPTTWFRIIGLDETLMTATVVREWTEKDWEEPKIGGVSPAGDNWLICQGHFLPEPLNERYSQLVELAPDDTVVWRLITESLKIQIYRSRRVAGCDLFHHAGFCPSLDAE